MWSNNHENAPIQKPKILEGLSKEMYSVYMRCLDRSQTMSDETLDTGNKLPSFLVTENYPIHIEDLMDQMTKWNVGNFTVFMASEFAFDDDQHVATNIKKMSNAGYVVKRIEGKSSKTGIVMNSLVSSTGFWLGGYYDCRKQESTTTPGSRFKKFIKHVRNSSPRHSLANSLFSLDRGYSQPYNLQTIEEEGAKFIATCRNASSRFFGSPFGNIEDPVPKNKREDIRNLDTKVRRGELYSYLGKKITKGKEKDLGCDDKKILYVGLIPKENVLICLGTNIESCKPYQVSRKLSPVSKADSTKQSITYDLLKHNVNLVTCLQRDAAWFLMRKFSITSTSALSIFKVLWLYRKLGNLLSLEFDFLESLNIDLNKFDMLASLLGLVLHNGRADDVVSGKSFEPELESTGHLTSSSTSSKFSQSKSSSSMHRDKSERNTISRILNHLPVMGIHVQKSLCLSENKFDNNRQNTSSKETLNSKNSSSSSCHESELMKSSVKSPVIMNDGKSRRFDDDKSHQTQKRTRQSRSTNDYLRIEKKPKTNQVEEDPISRDVVLKKPIKLDADNIVLGSNAIKDAFISNEGLRADIAFALIKKAFLPKFETNSTSIGLESENLVASNLNLFLSYQDNCSIQVQCFHDVGLVASKLHPNLQASVDKIATLKIENNPLVKAVVEIKAFSGKSSIMKLRNSTEVYGSYVKRIVDVDTKSCAENQDLIKLSLNQPYLVQCLHHAVVYDVEDCLLVFSEVEHGNNGFIRQVVHFRFKKKLRTLYGLIMGGVCSTFLQWCDPRGPISSAKKPRNSQETDCNLNGKSEKTESRSRSAKSESMMPWSMLCSADWLCTSAGTRTSMSAQTEIQYWLKLRRLIWNEKGTFGFPGTISFKPRMVELWNKAKSFVDKLGQTLANFNSGNQRNETHLKPILRILSLLALNATRAYTLQLNSEKVMNAGTLKEAEDATRSGDEKGFGFRAIITGAVYNLSVETAKKFCRGESVEKVIDTKSEVVACISAAEIEARNWERDCLIPKMSNLPKNKYKLVEAFQSEVLIDFRLSRNHALILSPNHTIETISRTRNGDDKRTRCVLCCEKCETTILGESSTAAMTKDSNLISKTKAHARSGHKTTKRCLACKVSLCITKKSQWKGRSCYDVWHFFAKFPKHPHYALESKNMIPPDPSPQVNKENTATPEPNNPFNEGNTSTVCSIPTCLTPKISTSISDAKITLKLREGSNEKRRRDWYDTPRIHRKSNKMTKYQDGNEKELSRGSVDVEESELGASHFASPQNLLADLECAAAHDSTKRHKRKQR